MGRKKKEQTTVITPISSIDTAYMMAEYQHNLETNPEYSLDVDPQNKYNMSDMQKAFIKQFIQFKSVPVAAKLSGLKETQAFDVFDMYSTQQEIRRINRALYARQFTKKMASVEEIGGWLTSLLMDEVPYADRLKSTDKLRVASMLLDLNNAKQRFIEDPDTLMKKNFEMQVKDMSLEAIRNLINADTTLSEKHVIINQLNKDKRLSAEDISFLETLSINELLQMVNKINGGK